MNNQDHILENGKIQAILEARARALARAGAAESPGATLELAVLALGVERYGVDIQHVVEIRPLGDLTAIPGVPPIWAGVENLRGTIYPVLDLAVYLELAPRASKDGKGRAKADKAADQKVVLVSGAGLRVGLLVDDVPAVQQVLQADIQPLPADAAGARREILVGVTPDLLSVLDLEALLGDPRLVVQDDTA